MEDQLYANGRILESDGRFVPGSILVSGGTIKRVLPPGERLPDVPAVDLDGRAVIPGFVDSHIHLSALALKKLRCDLAGTGGAREVADRLAAAGAGGRGPIVGVDWDESGWEDPSIPTRALLDGVARDRPVYARRICGHLGVGNSALLSLLDPHPGFIDRDAGVLTEGAVEAANRLCVPPASEIVPAVGEAVADLHRLGITGIHDIVSRSITAAYLEGVRKSPPLRIDALQIGGPEDLANLTRASADIDPGKFRASGIKLFSDGSLGGRTAALNAPYNDAQTIGEFLLDEADLERTLRRCCDAGVTCAVHAIGDRALRTVLLAMSRFPSHAGLFRIEHAEVIGWDELRLLENTRVYLSMQPNFVRNWQQPGGLYERRLGRERWSRCNPFRTLRDRGVRYAFGSDGMPPGPLYGIGGATRHPVPGERLTLAEALLDYTAAPTSSKSNPRRSGRLARDEPADLVVLSGDPDSGDPDKLGVDLTVVGGRPVYRRAVS